MIVINNRDYNIDQNNRDYDFGHNRAALVETKTKIVLISPTETGEQHDDSALELMHFFICYEP